MNDDKLLKDLGKIRQRFYPNGFPETQGSNKLKEIPMQKGELLSRMIMLATEAHHDQFDKHGVPYILHPMKVMHYLKTEDEELQCIALGHDILEDTTVTETKLAMDFTPRIVAGIKALTKVDGESQAQYENKVIENVDAMRVKLCDLRHNSDIRRLKSVSERDMYRLDKYCKFYNRIKEAMTDVMVKIR